MADEGWTGDELVRMLRDRLRGLRNGNGPAWEDWMTEIDDAAEEWLVEPVVPKGCSVALYAPGGVGKSLFVQWLTASLATGSAIFGHKSEPVSVAYFDYEMSRALVRERILWDMGFAPEALNRQLWYRFVNGTIPPLDTDEGGSEIIRLADEVKAELVVFDTTGRTLSGEENSADTLRDWNHYTGAPLKGSGRTVVRVDHAGKDLGRGQRGTSAKNDDVDIVWQMTALDGNRYRLRATKRRIHWVPEVVELEQTTDPLGYQLVLGDVGAWPAGTGELARVLDDLGVPVDISRRKAANALREAGHQATNAVLGKALKYRREGARTTARTTLAGVEFGPIDGPSEAMTSDLHGPLPGPLRTGVHGDSGPVSASREADRYAPRPSGLFEDSSEELY